MLACSKSSTNILKILVTITTIFQISTSSICKPKAPINIDYPFLRSEISPEFKFFEIRNPKMQKINHDHFRLLEDTGLVVKSGKTYHFSQVDFFSPSLHKLSNKVLDMEMQIKGFTKDNKKSITLVILFEKAVIPFIHLFKLGIGRNMISKLSKKNEDPRNSFMTLHTDLNFSPYVEDVTRFIHYKGDDLTGKLVKGKKGCLKTEYLILFEKLWIGQEQLLEFRYGGIRSWSFDTKIETRKIFANFVTQEVDKQATMKEKKAVEDKKKSEALKRKQKKKKEEKKNNHGGLEHTVKIML